MQKERRRIVDGDMIEPVQRMYAESMKLSEKWARHFREFWQLDDDFAFDVPTPEVELALAMREPEPSAEAIDGRSPS
jgi:N-methylhydantoinase B/acetone carboxylase alpha subunit